MLCFKKWDFCLVKEKALVSKKISFRLAVNPVQVFNKIVKYLAKN